MKAAIADHDWGVTVSPELTFDQIAEVRDGLRSGQIRISLGDDIPFSPELEAYVAQLTEQIVAAYGRALVERGSNQ